MATIRDAIEAYRPEVVLEKPVEPDEAMNFLAEKSGVDVETVRKVIGALPELAFWFLVRGRPVLLPGLGQLRPTISLHGKFGAALAGAAEISQRMSEPEAYRAGVKRKENIGVPLDRLAQMWNSGHPDDPVSDVAAYAVSSSAG